MKLPCKDLEQITYNTKPMIYEHLLINLDKSIHEEHFSAPLQINNEHPK